MRYTHGPRRRGSVHRTHPHAGRRAWRQSQRALAPASRALTPGDQKADEEARSGGDADGLPWLFANIVVARGHDVLCVALDTVGAVRDGLFRARQSTFDSGPQAGNLGVSDVRDT